MLKSGQIYTITVDKDNQEQRLDIYLQAHFKDYSRTFFQELIKQSAITINGKSSTKAGYIIKSHDTIVLTIPERPTKPTLTPEHATTLGIEIVFSTNDFAIINKPAGIVVHPPHKNSTSLALTDWLVTQFNDLEEIGYADRPGIVHRLDKDTSGLMIIPLTAQAHAQFSEMFKNRTIQKTYLCLVQGHPEQQGVVTLSIKRDQRTRNKMSTDITGRASETLYTVVTYFKEASLVKVQPKTGRTHQIRVHMHALGHPLLGDTLYGKTSQYITRQALHASQLSFTYNGKDYVFEAPLPADFQRALDCLPSSL